MTVGVCTACDGLGFVQSGSGWNDWARCSVCKGQKVYVSAADAGRASAHDHPRREDWPERLMQVIERHDRMPHTWGASDCYLLPIDCVVAMTGHDPCPELRGTYDTAIGAARALLARGFRDVGEAFASVFPEIPNAMAQRGDIGAVRLGEAGGKEMGWGGVVFVGAHAIGKDAAGGLDNGNRRVPRALVTRAFRVA